VRDLRQLKADLAEIERLEAKQRSESLLAYVLASDPTYLAGWVHEAICAKLEQFSADVRAERSPRLMLTMPPRHGKSFIASERFPVWHLGRAPHHRVVIASYGQELANTASRRARSLASQAMTRRTFPRLRVDGARRAMNDWETTAGGSMRAVGLGAGITGHGGHVIIIDDPIKGAEAAASPAIRAKVWDWYTSDLYTRRMPGAGILVIQTRWHDDDLAGRLLRAIDQDPMADRWEVINFPAIAEDDEPRRRRGEALHEARFPLDELVKTRGTVGPRTWASLYQQRPVPDGGAIFRREWFRYYREIPARDKRSRLIQSWDTAQKAAQHNDFSVCTTWLEVEQLLYLLDVYRARLTYPQLRHQVVAQADKWRDLDLGPDAVLIEDKGSGTDLLNDLKADRTFRYSLIPIEPIGDKVLRADREAPAFEAGRVYLPERHSGLAELEHELVTFPAAAHDDQVDSVTQALRYFRERRRGADYARRMAQL